MVKYRLQLIAPGVAHRLETESDVQLRKVILAVCAFALQRANLDSPEVEEAMRCLEAGRPVPAAVRSRLEQHVEALDEEYFHLKEELEVKGGVEEATEKAFHKARAAAAVLFGCGDDAVFAANEAAYEANAAAHDDTEALRDVVLEALGNRGDSAPG